MTASPSMSTSLPPSGSPLFPDIGVISLVPERWGGLWLSRHQILTRLSRYFNVLWFNPAREWRELLHTAGRPAEPGDPLPPASTGFIVHSSSKCLPLFYRPSFLVKTTASLRYRAAERILRNQGCTKTVLYIWTDQYADSLALAKYDISCYHITDEYSFSEIEHQIPAHELELLTRVDQVFIASPALMKKKGTVNPHTLHIPNGVDYAGFSDMHPEPADLAAVPRPRMGYIGRIKVQLDWDLLERLVSSHPEFSFVFAGPIGFMGDKADKLASFFDRRNVFYLGDKPHDEIAAYMQHTDAGLLCYAVNDYTKYIYPLKLHEYLAAGTPVVGADIPSLSVHSSVVRIARTPGEWSAAIAESLAPEARSPDSIARRRSVAREYDWNMLVHRIAESLCERLGDRRSIPPFDVSPRRQEGATA
jgi:glycosyltransferase involved in cell wall biosynthesis